MNRISNLNIENTKQKVKKIIRYQNEINNTLVLLFHGKYIGKIFNPMIIELFHVPPC